MENLIESIIDWNKFDASTDLSQRMNGVTEGSIKLEVELWDKQLKLLDPLDFKSIKEEINEWAIEIPPTHALTFENIASTYSRLVSYKTSIAKLIANAKAWKDTCESAIKYLEDLVPGAYPGTAAVKKSNSASVVQPFIHLKNQTLRVENYLMQMHGAIVFCAQQLDLLIKERQSRSKLNIKLGHMGEEILASSYNEQQSEEPVEITEDDGEVFQLATKKRRE